MINNFCHGKRTGSLRMMWSFEVKILLLMQPNFRGGGIFPLHPGSDGPVEMLVNKFAKGKTEHYSYLGFI